MSALLILSAVQSQARRPHRYGRAGMHHGYYSAAIFHPVRSVRVERTTTISRTNRQERKLLAVAYIKNNGYLTVRKYCSITRLGKQFAQAELDSFALDRKDPIVRTVNGKKVVYTLPNE